MAPARRPEATPEHEDQSTLQTCCIAGALLVPWEQRSRSAHKIQTELQQRWNGSAGVRVAAFQFPPLMGIVIFTGMAMGTLFVVPAMYLFLGQEHQREVEAREFVGDPASGA